MNFQTFHTQGLIKIGDAFYVTAVEVLESTVRNGASTDSLYDFRSIAPPAPAVAGCSRGQPPGGHIERGSRYYGVIRVDGRRAMGTKR